MRWLLPTPGVGARLPAGYRARAFETATAKGSSPSANKNTLDGARQRGGVALLENLMKDPTPASAGQRRGAEWGIAPRSATSSQELSRLGRIAPVRLDDRAGAASRKGIGTVLLEALEAEARRARCRSCSVAPNEGEKFALDWALARGSGRSVAHRLVRRAREVRAGRVLGGAREGARRRHQDHELRGQDRGRDAAAQEQWWRALYAAEEPMWADIPFATPTPHWPYDRSTKRRRAASRS